MNQYLGDQKSLPSPSGLRTDSPPHGHDDGTAGASVSPGQNNSVSAAITGQNGPTAASAAATRIRRRNRMITSCLECRRRKLKCDKSHPCLNCTKFRRECVFLSKDMDPASQLKLTEIKEKVGSLERLLERDIAKPPTEGGDTRIKTLPGDEDDDLPAAEDERDLEPTPLAVVDAAYEEGDEVDDDLLDLGIAIGRVRITERIGGFVRPKFAEELTYTVNNKPKSATSPGENPQIAAQPFFSPDHSFLKPGPSYIAPASGFFFGHGNSQASLIDFLPSRLAADRLIKQYFDAVHPIARLVHRPTFERDYEAFWQEVTAGIEPPPPLQTIIFAAMFSGVVSMEETVILRDFGVSKVNLIENFKTGTETALGRANFLRTTKVATLQGFVMYMIPLCREEISRAHSVLVGAAIRMAECMGMHRDGSHYSLTPLETHVRRLIWYQLCFLDVRTCEAQGPRPSIRASDFDTKLPGNYDDSELHSTGPPPQHNDRWTDVTFSLLRFECNEMFRTIWADRSRLEAKKISLTAILAKIETFKKNMAANYDHLFDDRIPLQRAAKITKALMLSRLHIMVLHRYHNSVTNAMPDRLRTMMVSACTLLCETAIALETQPDLAPWRWYVGAYTQYHAAMLLLVDVFFYKDAAEADRIWPCLDYIFQTDRSKSREERGRAIFAELQEKSSIYAERRKLRAPEGMLKHVGQRPPTKVVGGKDGRLFRDPSEGLIPLSTNEAPDETAWNDSVGDQRDARASGSNTDYDGTQAMQPTVGKMTLEAPEAIFAGVSNGEALWALPNQNMSPENSGDTNQAHLGTFSTQAGVVNTGTIGSASGVAQGHDMATAGPPVPRGDDLMAEIDWVAFDALFPPDQNMSEAYGADFSSSLRFTY